MVSNYKDFLEQDVLRVLSEKRDSSKQIKQRGSKMLKLEKRELKSRLDGSYSAREQMINGGMMSSMIG